jgi:short-subunit dehydrogenase
VGICLRACLLIDLQLKQTSAEILEIDFTDEVSIETAAKKYGDNPLDCLINCGGVFFEPIFSIC